MYPYHSELGMYEWPSTQNKTILGLEPLKVTKSIHLFLVFLITFNNAASATAMQLRAAKYNLLRL